MFFPSDHLSFGKRLDLLFIHWYTIAIFEEVLQKTRKVSFQKRKELFLCTLWKAALVEG